MAEYPKPEHTQMHFTTVTVPNDHAGYDHECPVCLVVAGAVCLNSKPGWIHRARMSVGRALNMKDTEGKLISPFLSFRYAAAETVSCPVCLAAPGDECFTDERLGGVHMDRVKAI